MSKNDENVFTGAFGDDEDFIIGPTEQFNFHDSPLYQAMVQVVEGMKHDMIPAEYVELIAETLPESYTPKQDIYDEKFNLRDELTLQIQYVRNLRNEIFDDKGKLRKGYGMDDAKHILTASRDLVKILQTSHDQLLSHDRMQAIEMAFIDTVAEMDEGTRERYAELLGVYLESHEPL